MTYVYCLLYYSSVTVHFTKFLYPIIALNEIKVTEVGSFWIINKFLNFIFIKNYLERINDREKEKNNETKYNNLGEFL